MNFKQTSTHGSQNLQASAEFCWPKSRHYVIRCVLSNYQSNYMGQSLQPPSRGIFCFENSLKPPNEFWIRVNYFGFPKLTQEKTPLFGHPSFTDWPMGEPYPLVISHSYRKSPFLRTVNRKPSISMGHFPQLFVCLPEGNLNAHFAKMGWQPYILPATVDNAS